MIDVTKDVCFGYCGGNMDMFHCSILGLQEQDSSTVEK